MATLDFGKEIRKINRAIFAASGHSGHAELEWRISDEAFDYVVNKRGFSVERLFDSTVVIFPGR